MAQSPITVIDGTETAAVARVEINGALEALATLSSGATAPSTTFSGMFWHDTSTGILKIRSEADDAWINVGYLDQSTNEFKPYVGGTQVDTQSTATWEAGTSTTEGIVSPAKVKAGFDSYTESTIFESSEITIPTGGVVSAAHGLGSTPRFARVVLRCKTASRGFSVGDETTFGLDTGGEEGPAPIIHANSTDVFLNLGDSGHIRFIGDDNFTWGGSGKENFKLVFYAHA